jgi:ribosomal protein L44E
MYQQVYCSHCRKHIQKNKSEVKVLKDRVIRKEKRIMACEKKLKELGHLGPRGNII